MSDSICEFLHEYYEYSPLVQIRAIAKHKYYCPSEQFVCWADALNSTRTDGADGMFAEIKEQAGGYIRIYVSKFVVE